MKEREVLSAALDLEELEGTEELQEIKDRLAELDREEEEERALAYRPPAEWWSTLDVKDHLYPDLKLTKEEQKRVTRDAKFRKTGIASEVPMTCPSRYSCSFAKGWETGGGHCEYAKIKKEPVGKPCIVEVDLIIDRTRQYAAQFDIGGTPAETVDRLQCMQLAEFDVYETRVTRILGRADQSELTELNCIGVDEAEQPIYAKQISLAWHLKTQIQSRRDKVLKALVATREAKGKMSALLGKRDETDHSTGFGTLMQTLKDIDVKNQEIQDAEFTEE